MSMWKYITKTPRDIKKQNRQEYKELCAQRNKIYFELNVALNDISKDLPEQYDFFPSNNSKACILSFYWALPDTGRDSDPAVIPKDVYCSHYSFEQPCSRKSCPYYERNVKYFELKQRYREACDKVFDFWPEKYRQCR